MTIEKGVPMPVQRANGNHSWKELDDMQVGDSVFDGDAKKADTKSSKAYSAMINKAKKYGWRVSGRTVEGGVRIWRVE